MMLHYYLYIESGATLDETTKFYKVGVSQSKQGDRDYLFLTAYSVQHGHYFTPWSVDAADFMHRCLLSIGRAGTDSLDGCTVVQVIKARALVKAFKTSTQVESVPHQLANQHHVLTYLSVNYRCSSRGSNPQNSLPCGTT